MYCVKCGVELADSEKKCPLCMTPVYYPEADKLSEPTYPPFQKQPEKVSPRGVYFIITFVFLVSGIISVICDLNLGNGVVWAGYVVGGLATAYVIFILPGWFERSHPAVFIPTSFAAVALYLLYVSLVTGGDWFLPFALPVCGGVALIVVSVGVLSHYLKRGYLYIWGGALIATGFLSVLIDVLVNLVFFDAGAKIFWSVYPLTVFLLFGLMLIVIAIVKPFKESLKKIFAI